MLRIFPLYYLIVGVGLVLNLSPARDAWPWLATYTFNIYLAKLGWFTEYYPHLWTLAIEEQLWRGTRIDGWCRKPVIWAAR